MNACGVCVLVCYLSGKQQKVIGCRLFLDWHQDITCTLHAKNGHPCTEKFAFNAITKFLFSFLWNKSFVLLATYIDIDYSYLPSVSYYFRTQCNQYLFVLQTFGNWTRSHKTFRPFKMLCTVAFFVLHLFFVVFYLPKYIFKRKPDLRVVSVYIMHTKFTYWVVVARFFFGYNNNGVTAYIFKSFATFNAPKFLFWLLVSFWIKLLLNLS